MYNKPYNLNKNLIINLINIFNIIKVCVEILLNIILIHSSKYTLNILVRQPTQIICNYIFVINTTSRI